MKIAIGCDHGGFELKRLIMTLLEGLGHEVLNQGCNSSESVDYPVFGRLVCTLVEEGKCDRGILICGTGIGMSIVANRFRGIRAALCHETYSARMSREHNDSNVLCLGERVTGSGLALEIVRTWLSTEFAAGRHLQRIKMI